MTEKVNHDKEIAMLNEHIHISNNTIDENNKLISILQKQIQKFNAVCSSDLRKSTQSEMDRPLPPQPSPTHVCLSVHEQGFLVD